MALLAELYVATRTRNTADAETENAPTLVVRRGTAIVFTKQLFGGDFRTSRGAGAVWRFDLIDTDLDSGGLEIELWATGDDAWSPEHVIVWGIAGRGREERVIPLAAFLDLASPVTAADRGVWVSSDTGEGERFLFVPSVDRGQDTTRARRVIVISATEAYGAMFPLAAGPGSSLAEAGTVGPLTLQAGGAGRLLLSYTLPATPQGDLAQGAAAFYIVDLAAPFSRADLTGGSFTLTIESDDWWKPDYFAVFGVDTVTAGPNVLVPFVAASAADLRQMSSDPAEGWHSVVLKTAQVVPQRPVGPETGFDQVDGVLAARGPHGEDQDPRAEGRQARE